jgi:hypothetical protein
VLFRAEAGAEKGAQMLVFQERYVVDATGQRVAVLLDIEDFKKILEALEELEAIRAYDEAVASGEEAIPFEQAMAEIEQARQ